MKKANDIITFKFNNTLRTGMIVKVEDTKDYGILYGLLSYDLNNYVVTENGFLCVPWNHNPLLNESCKSAMKRHFKNQQEDRTCKNFFEKFGF